ncbi:TPA: hypothetical protein I7E95_002507 [Vibrio cholerae]|nr:hypothetical protein [Vibrio cholerae]
MNEPLTIQNANIEAMREAALRSVDDADRVVDAISHIIAGDESHKRELGFLDAILVKESILSIHGQLIGKLSPDNHPANYALELLAKAQKGLLKLTFDEQSLFCPLQFELPRR